MNQIAVVVLLSASVSIYFLIATAVPVKKCATTEDCTSFCDRLGYNKSDCIPWMFRLTKLCVCAGCEFVKCANYCTGQGLKFIGCNCFNLPLPTDLATMDNSANRQLTNDCADDKFYCQCSK